MHFRDGWCRVLVGIACIPGTLFGAMGKTDVVERGPHHSVIQETVVSREPGGGTQVTTNTWVQIEDGINYWDAEAGQWRESVPEVEIAGRGAVARRGQHRAIFSSNVNDPEGALDLEISGSVRLRSSVLALRYFDAATGGTVILGTVQDTRGELLPPNQVIYRNVFDDVRADLVYTYRRRGVEADVVLRELPPNPEEFGLMPETTRLEVVTEFFDPPEPTKRDQTLSSLDDPQLRQNVAEPDWVDQDLDFGPSRIGPGRAFSWSAREAAERRPDDFPVVGKTWVRTVDGRTLLIESVDYFSVLDELRELPGTAMRRQAVESLREMWAGREAGEIREAAIRARGGSDVRAQAGSYRDAVDGTGVGEEWALLRRPAAVASVLGQGLLLATSARVAEPGLVVDWATITTGAVNFTFAGTNTYYVTGTATFSGKTTIEGGAVVKFPVNGGPTTIVTIAGTLECRTSAYRPAVFTADADNSVGETVSGGTPGPEADYGSRQLRFLSSGFPVTVEHLRFKHGFGGVYFEGYNPDSVVRHCQFVQCRNPIASTAVYPVRLRNVLIHGGKATGAALTGSGTVFTGEHLTVHQFPALLSGASLALTNSVIVAVTSVGAFSGVGNLQFASAAGVFRSVGAGNHYLPAVSGLRNAGVTGIHPLLLRDLGELTTDGPVVIESDLTDGMNLLPVARRDSDTPDIGYHYTAIDYAMGGRSISSGTARIGNGSVIAMYGNTGLMVGRGARVDFIGTPSAPVRLLYYSMVQEQTVSPWLPVDSDVGLFQPLDSGVGSVGEVRFEFVESGMPGGLPPRKQLFRRTGDAGYVLRSANSRFFNVRIAVPGNRPGVILALTNNLLEDAEFSVTQSGSPGFHPVDLQAYNNLFRGGSVLLSNTRVDSPWTLSDNLFDPLGLVASGLSGNLSHNGFRTGVPAFGTPAYADLNVSYAGGALGPFTYPVVGGSKTLAALINTGSRNATAAGLSRFTVRSDGVQESGSTVDVGFHYPAPAPVTTGPVAYWKLDESAGLTAFDSGPMGSHGTLVNGPVWTSAQNGNGLALDGINDQVTVSDAPHLRLASAFSVTFWVRKQSEATEMALYLGKGGAAAQNFAVWDEAGASGNLVFQFHAAGGLLRSITSQRPVVPGRWYHVACTWDGATGRIYLDGEIAGLGAMTGPPVVSSDPVVMGYAGHQGRFSGVLDDVCLFQRALSPTELSVMVRGSHADPVGERRLGHWRLDESTGYTATDSSGRGNHGTLSWGPQWRPGRFGNGLTFNGTDDQVTIPDAAGLRPAGAFSLAFWVNKSSEPADFTRIVGKGSNGTRNYGVWDIAGPSGRIMLQFHTPDRVFRTVSSVRELQLGTWHHVACTWDGAVGRIYIDGILDATASMPGPAVSSSDPLTLGFAGYHTYFAGGLDEVVFLDRALSQGEVTALATTAGAEAGMSGLQGAWRMNQSEGSTVTDASPNARHGLLSPGPGRVGGPVGGALTMDGLSDWVTVPDHVSLRPVQAMTVMFWVRKRVEDADFVRFVGKGRSGARNFGVWDAAGSSGAVLFQFQVAGGAFRTVVSRRHLPIQEWHHVAATWDGATGRLYLDGELDAAGPMAGPPVTSTEPLTIGYAGYHGRLAGEMDDVVLLDRALTDLEVASWMRSRPADSDLDGAADITEDPNGNAVREAGETSLTDPDADYDGRSDAEERADGTDPADPRSLKPVLLGMWDFDNPSDPWRGSNGSVPWERNGVALISAAPFVFGAEINGPSDVLRYRDVEVGGRANINALQGTVKLHYFPYWSSFSPDCGPGTMGFGPGATIELLSVGDFSIAIDGKGTNLMLRSPAPGGGYVTNVQAKFHACLGEYLADFPMEIQVSYGTNSSAIFLNGQLLARGSGVASAPNRGSRGHGLFFGSGPERTAQLNGILDAVLTYNVPLDMCTNATLVSVSVSNAPPSVTLRWTAVSNCFYLVERRTPSQGVWQRVGSSMPPSFTDTTVVAGQEYEYRLSADAVVPLEMRASTDPKYLTITAGQVLPQNDSPGHVLLVVDSTLTGDATFASEVTALTRDLSAEGWVVARFDGPRHDDANWANNPSRIATVKNWITNYRNANPSARAVYLLGHLPIPRSGLLSPDGHKHRPLPADCYYGDLDGVWTDVSNWPPDPSIEVPNLAGDGIFDQELVPPNASRIAGVELAVGRVDFANMPAFSSATPSRGEVDLLVQYIRKTRRFRRAELTLPERAIYGGYFSSNSVSLATDTLGQHLTQLAQRIGIGVVGTNSSGAVFGDYLSANLPAVWGIQGGFAGGYSLIHSRGDVNAFHGIVPHQTSDYVVDAAESPVAFAVMDASWMSEWNQPDHLSRALLATKNYGYAWSYGAATRIEWQYPVMALGKSLGDAWMKTMNDAWMWPLGSTLYQSQFGTGVRVFQGDRVQGGYVYTSLLGDPTLRQAPARPSGFFFGQTTAQGHISLVWSASPEPGAKYHVYRSVTGVGGAWTRLTILPTTALSYTDVSPPAGNRVYCVRTIVQKNVASGAYMNLSAGKLWP